jgi:hypothetical protein
MYNMDFPDQKTIDDLISLYCDILNGEYGIISRKYINVNLYAIESIFGDWIVNNRISNEEKIRIMNIVSCS